MKIQTLKNIQTSIKAFVLFTIITGGLYPAITTVFAKFFFPHQSSGSLINRGNVIIGSELVAQKFLQPKYFNPRPSAVDYATIPSGGSNLAPTSEALKRAISERRIGVDAEAPADFLTTSGSGLDPHITPESAQFQITRIAAARSLTPIDVARMEGMIQDYIEPADLSFLGKPRLNVLKLNIKLDQMFP